MSDHALISLDFGFSGCHCLLVDSQMKKKVSSFRDLHYSRDAGLGVWTFNLDTPLIWQVLGEIVRETTHKANLSPTGGTLYLARHSGVR